MDYSFADVNCFLRKVLKALSIYMCVDIYICVCAESATTATAIIVFLGGRAEPRPRAKGSGGSGVAESNMGYISVDVNYFLKKVLKSISVCVFCFFYFAARFFLCLVIFFSFIFVNFVYFCLSR